MSISIDSTEKQAEQAGMKWLEGGIFSMGSEHFYPEEAPVRQVRVDPFWIDLTPVTNRQFAAFAAATGHVTTAEIPPDPKDYPGLRPELAGAGSLVFERTDAPVNLSIVQWWDLRVGADWRHPLGPESDLSGLDDHPVVHVTHGDALAYARWAGKSLPTEAEWEYAARGGLEGAPYAWGDQLAPAGAMLANYWQGLFPFANQLLDGWERTSPVKTYPVNGYGLFDMIGNVWEWTEDWFGVSEGSDKGTKSCCIPANPRGATKVQSYDRNGAGKPVGRKVLKGGSHLCAANYCQRYRPAARYAQPIDTSTGHVGFRCVMR